MRIITVIGARPQFIKAATVSRRFKDFTNCNELIIHTGQHYDKNINDIFFNELNIPAPKYNLNVGSASHGYQTAQMIEKIETILVDESPDCVLVYGDTNTTIAAALAAVKIHIPVAHIEAGLRSYNRLMPEEINRIVTDSISDILFAPTLNAMNILKNEGKSANSYFSGDVMYDSVKYYYNKLMDNPKPEILKNLDEFYLCTIHRAENTDDIIKLNQIFSAFKEINTKIILPLHPRTKNKIKEYQLTLPDNIIVTEPLGYEDLLTLLIHSKKMITDSGGVQKEAYFLSKPCVTLRNETEWIETLDNNWNILCGTDTDKIVSAVLSEPGIQNNLDKFGDGDAASVIIKSLLSRY